MAFARKNKAKNTVKKRAKIAGKEDTEPTSPKLIAGVIVVLFALYLLYTFYGGGAPQVPANQSNIQEPATQTTIGATTPGIQMVSAIVLNDKRCGQNCSITNIMTSLKAMFPGLVVRNLDYSTPDGRAVYDKAGLTELPAVLFDSTVTESYNYKNVSEFLDKAGDYLSLRIKGTWSPYCDPTPEHCGEQACSGRLSCRQEMPGKLDIFVTSQGLYSIMALNAMKEVLETFKGEMNFSVHYVVYETSPGVFDSEKGQVEVNEDLRGVCAMKYYPDNYKFMDYIWCRNKNLQSAAWESCATESGMDAAKIKNCSVGDEGKRLLSDNMMSAKQLFITTSPTFLVNNKKTFNAINATGIQKGFCDVNKDLRGCSGT